jgi:exopolysaccharide biosynthesis polyprenyl glycosylphosphotransferase
MASAPAAGDAVARPGVVGHAVPLAELVVAPRYPHRDAVTRRVLALADAGAFLTGLATTAVTSETVGLEAVGWGALALPAWIVVCKAYGLYDRDAKRIGHSTLDDLPHLFHALLVASLILWLHFRLPAAPVLNFTHLLVFAWVTFAGVLVLRMAGRRAAIAALGAERAILAGEGDEIGVLAWKMRAHPEYHVDPIGLLCPDAGAATGERPAHGPGGLPILGRLTAEELGTVVRRYEIQRVVVAHSDVGERSLMEVLRRCRELRVKVSVLPQLFDVMGPSVEIDDIEGVTMLGIAPPVFPRSSRFLKRTMDVVGALAALVAVAPLLAVIAIAIQLDSPGPVLFRQQRIGRRGKPFALVKFRTMVADAEERRAALLAKSSDPHWLHLEHDPRITRLGRLLRLSSLDEVPQLWNVLRGEMSLVGPRPILESEDRQLDGWRRSRVDLTPGLTGLWQVLGRTRIPFEEMVKLDYLYVTNWSLWTDVRLILRTVPAVLHRRGAN